MKDKVTERLERHAEMLMAKPELTKEDFELLMLYKKSLEQEEWTRKSQECMQGLFASTRGGVCCCESKQ